MPQASLVAEALRAWREAERALDATPPGSPEHETVRLHVAELRAAYSDLTERGIEEDSRLPASETLIERAGDTLDRVRSGRMGTTAEPATD